jgi:hypothetical protein
MLVKNNVYLEAVGRFSRTARRLVGSSSDRSHASQNKSSRPEDAAAELKELVTELKAQVVRARLSCAVCSGARPPERADRGRLRPRLVRPGANADRR